MKRQWQPGDVVTNGVLRGFVVEDKGNELRVIWPDGSSNRVGMIIGRIAPLATIDTADREQVERLTQLYRGTFGYWGDEHVHSMQAALREFANPTPPKPYRIHEGTAAPWPVVGECHSSNLPDHECPQCAWEHAHDWVSWGPGQDGASPIRCAKCGGRKCDVDLCDQRRHTHTHADSEGVRDEL